MTSITTTEAPGVSLTSTNGAPYEINAPKLDAASDSNEAAEVFSARVAQLDPFDVEVNWPAGGEWQTTSADIIAKTGITRWKIVKGGLVWEYRLWFTNIKKYNYEFVDASGDHYLNKTSSTGDHYIDYNSDAPTITHVYGF
ncbi:hypothetical protein CPLU01_12939 [Colletotrichum plurivorum]|uniref:Uncharacterized protein n=1 Tax=Colletotrichum plurivorum TaxID=2175906 RepID=A0A8H6JVY8_9PEZI|nr:hypothetical protein CPLU01_12939 [Colletotrichum plurivorum]